LGAVGSPISKGAEGEEVSLGFQPTVEVVEQIDLPAGLEPETLKDEEAPGTIEAKKESPDSIDEKIKKIDKDTKKIVEDIEKRLEKSKEEVGGGEPKNVAKDLKPIPKETKKSDLIKPEKLPIATVKEIIGPPGVKPKKPETKKSEKKDKPES
jgi:hypothetical protein